MNRRHGKLATVLLAFGVLGIAFAACTIPKQGSLRLDQPSGIGAVHFHFELCSELGPDEGTCDPSENELEAQLAFGIAVPPGSDAPAAFTASPTVGGGAPIAFTRNDQVAQELSEPSPFFEGETWPPAGTEGIGYLSTPFLEKEGVLREWSIDTDFGLPPGVGGHPYVGPFRTSIAFAYRAVGGKSGSPDRPLDCAESSSEPVSDKAYCGPFEAAETGTSDLTIPAPPASRVPVGGQAAIGFPFDFASTAASQPSFGLSATSSLPGATLALSAPTYAPGPPAGDTHRSPSESRTVTVTVPKTASPGTYDVSLTAATAQGAEVSQVARLVVSKTATKRGGSEAALGFGKLKLNRKNGTATLLVTVSTAGQVTLSGKRVKAAKRAADGAGTLKLTIKARGRAKKRLATTGKATVKAKVTFAPSSGAPVSRSRKLTLKKRLG